MVGAGVCFGQGAVLCLAGCALTGPLFATISAAGAAVAAGGSALAGGVAGTALSHLGV
jgi:hypothetical protein